MAKTSSFSNACLFDADLYENLLRSLYIVIFKLKIKLLLNIHE
jgi:hypothetical protein